MFKKLSAEFLGTFWLVFGGCGSAVLAAAFPDVGIGLLGVSLAFGLTVLTMAYADRPHLRLPLQPGGLARPVRPAGASRPASSLPYIVAQVLGAHRRRRRALRHRQRQAGLRRRRRLRRRTATASTRPAATRLLAGAGHRGGDDRRSSCSSSSARPHSRAPAGFAPIAIGLALTLIHLISIPVTNTSVNPARSTGPALFVRRAGRWRSSGCSGWRRSSAPRSPELSGKSSVKTINRFGKND